MSRLLVIVRISPMPSKTRHPLPKHPVSNTSFGNLARLLQEGSHLLQCKRLCGLITIAKLTLTSEERTPEESVCFHLSVWELCLSQYQAILSRTVLVKHCSACHRHPRNPVDIVYIRPVLTSLTNNDRGCTVRYETTSSVYST